MTCQALVVALESRHLTLLVEAVENHALLCVLSCDLQHRSAAHPPHSDRVCKKHGARIARIDQGRLRTGLGEHDDLRLDRNVERSKHRSQISARAVAYDADLTVLDLPIQPRYPVVNRARGVRDCGMIARDLKRIGTLGKDDPRTEDAEQQRWDTE